MKKWITLGLGALTLFTSCQKDGVLVSDATTTSATAASNGSISARTTTSSTTGISASSWMQSSSWSSYDSSSFRIYTTEMSAPEVSADALSNGAVITYGRVSVSAPEYAQFNDPQVLPFYFVGTNARPQKDAFYFFDRYAPGTVRISYSTMATDGSMPAGASLSQFQFRTFVIPASFLVEHNITADDIRSHYTYSQMMDLAGIKE